MACRQHPDDLLVWSPFYDTIDAATGRLVTDDILDSIVPTMWMMISQKYNMGYVDTLYRSILYVHTILPGVMYYALFSRNWQK